MASDVPNQRTIDVANLQQPECSVQANAGDRELSDDELDAVSGGWGGLFRMKTAPGNKYDDSAKNVIQKLSQG